MPPKTYPNMTDWWENQSYCVASPPISWHDNSTSCLLQDD
jgi:hypothetical protein